MTIEIQTRTRSAHPTTNGKWRVPKRRRSPHRSLKLASLADRDGAVFRGKPPEKSIRMDGQGRPRLESGGSPGTGARCCALGRLDAPRGRCDRFRRPSSLMALFAGMREGEEKLTAHWFDQFSYQDVTRNRPTSGRLALSLATEREDAFACRYHHCSRRDSP